MLQLHFIQKIAGESILEEEGGGACQCGRAGGQGMVCSKQFNALYLVCLLLLKATVDIQSDQNEHSC